MKRFKRKLDDCLFTVPEADLPILASMASPLHQRIVFVNPPSVLDDGDDISSYDREHIESWTSPPPIPFIPHPPSKTGHPSWMQACTEAVEALMKMPGARDFSIPVDAAALGLHDYFDVVKNPMDLGTIKSKLMSQVYEDAHDFCDDVRLTFSNCVLYNSLESPIGAKAAKMWKVFCQRWFCIIDGFTGGIIVPYNPSMSTFTEGIMDPHWYDNRPVLDQRMRELYWTCVLGNEGQCIGPDEVEQHSDHVLYGYLKKENEKHVSPAPIALRNIRDLRFEGSDWLNEYHPTCPGRKAILRFWVLSSDYNWYRLSTPAPSYFPTYWLSVRRQLIVSRAVLCLSSFPNLSFDDLIAMMQNRYFPPIAKSNAKGPQAAAQQKIATDYRVVCNHLASVVIIPPPTSDEVVAMYERIVDSLKQSYNVNPKFSVSSSAACSVAERKFKQLLKKLSEIDSFPPPDVVDLGTDVLAEPEDRSGSSRGKSKSSKHDDDNEVKEKKKRGRKKGSTYPSDRSKKADGESTGLKRRKSDESTEGVLKKKRKRRSGGENRAEKSKEEKSKQPIAEGEKRKRDRKAEKERRDAAKLAEFGGSIAEIKLTDEQRRERDALACVLCVT
jgi:hypothetical protein